MIRMILVLLFALICAALGNVALSHGMRQVGALETDQFRSLIRYFALAVFNPWVIVGMIMELAYFFLWLVVLSWADLSWALPMHAIEYILVALLALVLLGEEINTDRWIGIVLITAGVMFMMKSWDEEKPPRVK
jgi:drug/metabolite transporter (DMT)-like permease